MYETYMIYDDKGEIREIIITKSNMLLRLSPLPSYAPTAEFQRADVIVQALIAYDKAYEGRTAILESK